MTFPELTTVRRTAILLLALMLAGCGQQDATKPDDPAGQDDRDGTSPLGRLEVPVTYHKLDNGLRVVLSEDHTAPTVTVGVYYNIGFRIEPRDRTGFAHLFEHMMFQGSENLGKGEFINLISSNGGVLNGSTRYDFTNYYEVVPSHALEPVLWAEADRMKGLAITQDNLTNQQGVVKNEVKVNVLNQPYGGFPWLDMPQIANQNWHNAHNFYGELEDLDAATLEDVQAFFDRFYTPSNAVLVIAGDFEPDSAMEMVDKYFAPIAGRAPEPLPDISEPRQEEEKRASKADPLAPRPALAFSYHVPERGTPENTAMGFIDQLLIGGEDSLLHQKLVLEEGFTDSVFGGINMLGNRFDINGPTLFTIALIHDPAHESETILTAADEVIERLRNEPLDPAELERVIVKSRSAFYDLVGSSTRFGLVNLLAAFALFDDDPARINEIEAAYAAVTPELIQRTAQEYLRPGNRTILAVEPGAGGTEAGEEQ